MLTGCSHLEAGKCVCAALPKTASVLPVAMVPAWERGRQPLSQGLTTARTRGLQSLSGWLPCLHDDGAVVRMWLFKKSKIVVLFSCSSLKYHTLTTASPLATLSPLLQIPFTPTSPQKRAGPPETSASRGIIRHSKTRHTMASKVAEEASMRKSILQAGVRDSPTPL